MIFQQSCYYLSINDILWNVLNNPSLYNTLYFGPGIEAEEKKEYWHGNLWAESPLFGQDKIIINGGKEAFPVKRNIKT